MECLGVLLVVVAAFVANLPALREQWRTDRAGSMKTIWMFGVYLLYIGLGIVVVLLLARDIAITGLRSIAASEGVVIAAGEGGKSKTALQMVGILMLMIGYPYRMNFFLVDLGIVDLIHVGRWLIYISLVC